MWTNNYNYQYSSGVGIGSYLSVEECKYLCEITKFTLHFIRNNCLKSSRKYVTASNQLHRLNYALTASDWKIPKFNQPNTNI